MLLLVWLTLCILNFLPNCKAAEKVIVFCVGDSITKGSHATDKTKTSYPAVLEELLNKGGDTRFVVHNYGIGGNTVQKHGVGDGNDPPSMSYWDSKYYRVATSGTPSIVILQFGTNDAKSQNWNENRFLDDYVDMINSFKSLACEPVIFICIPPPIYLPFMNIQLEIVNGVLPKVIRKIAEKTGVRVIDLFDAMGGEKLNKQNLYLDKGKPIKWPNDGGSSTVIPTQ